MGYKDPDQQRAYQHRWITGRRDAWIAEHGPCAECGSGERLEVDHVDPSTKCFNPARIWSLSEEKRAAELAKCQVLCYACHKEKTRRQRATDPPHGTRARYTHGTFRCRCQLCRDANAEYMRELRKRSPVAQSAELGPVKARVGSSSLSRGARLM